MNVKFGSTFAAFAALALVTPAFAFSWDDAEEGAIVISEPVSVTTDADAAKMAALTAIELAEGGSISCSGLTTAITLPADFFGPGTFAAEDCAGITLTGDSSEFVGGFTFNNTPLVVGSRYGLGGEGTAALMFYYEDNGTLDFLWDETYMTNDVPIVVESVSGKSNQIFGPSTSGKYLVMRGGLKVAKGYGDHWFYFRGKVIFDGGKFETPNGHHLYSSNSGTTEIWFTENATIYMGDYWFALGSEKYHFACTMEKLACYAPNTPLDTIFEKDNVFLPSTILSMYNGRTDEGASFDLNGYDQSLAYMQNQSAVEEGKFGHVTSSRAAATLTLCDKGTTERSADYKFTGKVSIHQTGNFVQKIINVVSTSVGDITVSSGGIEFADNGGWSGTNVVVEGGVLILNSPYALTTSEHMLTVSGTGKLRIHNTVSTTGAYLGEVTIGGVKLNYDTTYTVAELKQMDTVKDYIDASSDDDAVIRIAPEKFEWEGWPEEGGEVKVPASATVNILDADVEKVQRVTKLTLYPGCTVLCKNETTPLVLTATVVGSGTFDITSPAGVTLAGDSSGLDSPGCFIARDTVVTVTHRYGLGDAGTGAFQSLGGDLIFKGNGLTNDVAIFYNGPGARTFGARDCRGPWVQNGDFLTSNGDDSHYTHFTNDVVFGGSCRYGATSGGLLFYHLYNLAKFSADPDTTMYYPGGWCEYYFLVANTSGSSYDMAGKVTDNKIYKLHPHLAGTWFNCGAANIFTNLTEGFQAYGSPAPAGGFNLGGFDQQLSMIRIQDGEDKVEANKYCAIVHSDKPATLTITKPSAGTVKSGLKFTGAANFTYAATDSDPYKLYWQKSTSAGALTVESGNLCFEQGNSWGGTNVFLKGGTLYVSTESTNPFTAVDARKRFATELTVTDGTLDLAADVTANVNRAKVNGDYLPKGTYHGGDAQYPWLTGSGTLNVRRGGIHGMMLIVR